MENTDCSHECKYRREGKCTLERAEWVRPLDGAECMSHLFEDEDRCRT